MCNIRTLPFFVIMMMYERPKKKKKRSMLNDGVLIVGLDNVCMYVCFVIERVK